jgi:hypothetical protein
LAIPAIYAIFLVAHEQKTVRYTVFLGIFLVFLLIEWLYDYILKIKFSRELEAELEIDGTIFNSILRNELRIYSNAMENQYFLGIYNAGTFYYPDYYEFKKPS